jgi:hypothetical protein
MRGSAAVLQGTDGSLFKMVRKNIPRLGAMTPSVRRADAWRSLRAEGAGKKPIQAQAKEMVPARGSWDRSLEVPGGRSPTRSVIWFRNPASTIKFRFKAGCFEWSSSKRNGP